MLRSIKRSVISRQRLNSGVWQRGYATAKVAFDLPLETHTDLQKANEDLAQARANSAEVVQSGSTALKHAYQENTGFGTRPIYLDMQATTPTDPRVLDTMLKFYTGLYGNPHSNTHSYGWETNKEVELSLIHI